MTADNITSFLDLFLSLLLVLGIVCIAFAIAATTCDWLDEN